METIAIGLHYWWFKVRLSLFYAVIRFGLSLMPERKEDWFLEMLRGRSPDGPEGEREMHFFASDIEGRAAILLVEQQADGSRSSVKITPEEAEGILAFVTANR